MSSPPRSVTVDVGLLKRMARDAAIFSLTRPAAIVMWLALAAALLVSILNLTARTSAGQTDVGPAGWMPPLILLLAAYAVAMSISSARRAVRVAMPPETVVWVAVEADRLRVGADRRQSVMSYDTFQSMRVGADAVVLKLRDGSVATAIPRVLLTDEEIAVLRSRIG